MVPINDFLEYAMSSAFQNGILKAAFMAYYWLGVIAPPPLDRIFLQYTALWSEIVM